MPTPSLLLPATNAALRLSRRYRDLTEAWIPMLRQCEREFGLVPSGPEADALHRLLIEFEQEPDLSPMGRFGTARMHVWQRLRNVAQVKSIMREHSEIAAERVDDPIFVVGMPRTATTLAHHLLAAADGHRGPLMAEMISTRHHYTAEQWEATMRDAQRQITMLRRYERYFVDAIHPMYADRPEETYFCDVASRYFATTASLPGYLAWIEQQDPEPWYRWLKQVLQALQYDPDIEARPRWVLKQPGHLWHLETILRVFPRAKIIWTHREPETVCGSTFSLVEAMRRLYLRRRIFAPGGHGLRAIGEDWLRLLVDAVERGRTARAGLPPGAVIDVAYHRLTADPHTTVPELYERVGAPWGSRDRERLTAHFARPHHDRKHEYDLSRYGMTLDRVREAFGDYSDFVARLAAARH